MVSRLVHLKAFCLLIQVFKLYHDFPYVRFLRHFKLADTLVEELGVNLEQADDNSAAAVLDHSLILAESHGLSHQVKAFSIKFRLVAEYNRELLD